jgi:hypothetical protein
MEIDGSDTSRNVRLADTMTLSLSALGEERAMTQLLLFPDGSAWPGRFSLVDSGRQVSVEVGMLTGRLRSRR